MRIENWNGYNIRFVDHQGEWWAVLADIAEALELKAFKIAQRLDDDLLSKYNVKDTLGRDNTMIIVNEFGIYDTIFSSRKKRSQAV